MILVELKHPFIPEWSKGVVRMCEDGRRRITLWKRGEDGKLIRKGIAYARYLMSVHLGRYLSEDEHVDHKDEDKANDVIENLQILTPAENIKKNAAHRNKGKTLVLIMDCPVCKESFARAAFKVRYALNQGSKITCSKKCRGLLSKPPIQKSIITSEQHQIIVTMRKDGKSDYYIRDVLGVSRTTVLKHRQRNGIA